MSTQLLFGVRIVTARGGAWAVVGKRPSNMPAMPPDPGAGDVEHSRELRVAELLLECGAALGLDREPCGLRQRPGDVGVERGLVCLDLPDCALPVVALERPRASPRALVHAVRAAGRVVGGRHLDEEPPAGRLA